MKILIIGGKGTIGKKVSDHFSKKHEIMIGGRNSGDIVVDIANSKSIEAMFESSETSMQLSASLAKLNGQPLIQ